MRKFLILFCILSVFIKNVEYDAKELDKNIGSSSSESNVVIFNDPLFEQCVREQSSASDEGDITIDDVSTITSLQCDGYGMISDLTGIEYMENLVSFHSHNGYIEDLTPLSGLTKLEYLDLSGNAISDLSPLEPLVNLNYLDVQGQWPEVNITVYSDDEIFYNVISPDGTQTPISLGEPVEGTHTVIKDFIVRDISLGSTTDILFSGYITANITYIPSESSILSGNSNAQIDEGTSLTDTQLISLFEVNNSNGEKITVDQSLADYTIPGEYTITFSDESHNEFVGQLTVVDLLPKISAEKDSQNITLGDTNNDFVSLYGLSATEIEEGDLTDSIHIDSSNVDYESSGEYSINASVQDDEGNTDSIDLKLIINGNNRPVLTGKTKKRTTEESYLTDNELIKLFEVEATDTEDGIIASKNISVDQSLVDYSTPGEYKINFEVSDSSGNISNFTSELVITDKLPIIELITTEITLDIHSNLDNLMEKLDFTATEIVEGDLTSAVVIDDTLVDYDQIGNYPITLSVTDNEDNYTEATVDIIISSKPETDLVTDSDISGGVANKDENTNATNKNNDNNYSKMSLAETGSITIEILAILIASVFILIIVRFKLNR